MLRHTITIAILVWATIGCKPNTPESDAKTLDNFSRSENQAFNLNSCGPAKDSDLKSRHLQGISESTYKKWQTEVFGLGTKNEAIEIIAHSDSSKSKARSAVLSVLDIVPADALVTLRTVRSKVKIKIQVFADQKLEGQCDTDSNNDPLKEFGVDERFACTDFNVIDKKKELQEVTLRFGLGSLMDGREVSPIQAIRHGLLRTILMLEASIKEVSGEVFFDEKNENQLKLFAAFLADVKDRGGDVERMKDFSAELFAKNLSVELRDSYYCSEESLNIFKNEFKRTYYEAVIQAAEKLQLVIDDLKNEENSAKDSDD